MEEVNRRVGERVQKEMAASRAAQAQVEDNFLSRTQQEQDWAMFLMGFASEHEKGSGELDNFVTLVKAASVSFSSDFEFPRSRGGCIKLLGGDV